MRAYRLAGWKQGGHYVDLELPEPGPGQVRIKLGGAGICHSDLHIMHEWSPETMPALAAMDPAFTLGHENAGWVEDLGPGVSGWEKGQAVAISPVWSCGFCAPCRDGEDAYCEGSAGVSGGIGLDGGLASHMLAPARALVALDSLQPKDAAPLTDAGLTSYHAVKRSLPVMRPDAAVLVIGVGGLGHMAVAYLRVLTGCRIIATDRSPEALELALELGADLGLPSDGDTADAVREATAGLGVIAAFDFVGIDDTMRLAAQLIRKRGRITVVGLGGGSFPFAYEAIPHAATIGYTFGGCLNDLREVVALAEAGRVRPKITHFGFDEIEQAYQELHEGRLQGRGVILPE